MKLLKRLVIVMVLVMIAGSGLYLAELYLSINHSPDRNKVIKSNEVEKQVNKNIEKLPDLGIQASAVILINMDDGGILYDKNIEQSLPTASMSKMMTELLVLEAIQKNEIAWEQTIAISDYAYSISNHPGFSSVFLQKGQQYTIRELFDAMAIHSANGAAIALAEVVAGSEKDFVTKMNQKAQQIGLEQTNFVNSTGLNNKDLGEFYSVGSATDTNWMSAKDVALLARQLIEQFPDILDVVDESVYVFGEQTYTNTNWMLPELNKQNVGYDGVDGLKTGYTDEAGYCFAGTVKRNGERLISVVMGASSIVERFSETKLLYETAYSQ
ncbi:D-alanyl-D-alanine carboxypeptidase family protein [Gracilibacillus sp. D59]|uniref:D-alanyl-D-alanine carboxypeptidase family protein n=1 Tax=Gracilibacillus sp. D59 TaxID=3457434 RepID=UPI003FCCB228